MERLETDRILELMEPVYIKLNGLYLEIESLKIKLRQKAYQQDKLAIEVEHSKWMDTPTK